MIIDQARHSLFRVHFQRESLITILVALRFAVGHGFTLGEVHASSLSMLAHELAWSLIYCCLTTGRSTFMWLYSHRLAPSVWTAWRLTFSHTPLPYDSVSTCR